MNKLLIAAVLVSGVAFAQAPAKTEMKTGDMAKTGEMAKTGDMAGGDDAMMQKMMSPEMMQMHIDEATKMSEMHKDMAEGMEAQAKVTKDKAMKDHLMAMAKIHKQLAADTKKAADEMTKGKSMKMPADMKMDPKAMESMKAGMAARHDMMTMMQKEADMMK